MYLLGPEEQFLKSRFKCHLALEFLILKKVEKNFALPIPIFLVVKLFKCIDPYRLSSVIE